jgi:trimethylamine--corrinoid protein Co-methyltransferase
VKFPSARALAIWQDAGADVDLDRMIVKARPALIESALEHCPPAYTLAARDAAQDLPLDGNHVYLGTDGCGVEVIDLQTRDLRTALQDVRILPHSGCSQEIAFHRFRLAGYAGGNAGCRDPPSESLHKHVQTESIYSRTRPAQQLR